MKNLYCPYCKEELKRKELWKLLREENDVTRTTFECPNCKAILFCKLNIMKIMLA